MRIQYNIEAEITKICIYYNYTVVYVIQTLLVRNDMSDKFIYSLNKPRISSEMAQYIMKYISVDNVPGIMNKVRVLLRSVCFGNYRSAIFFTSTLLEMGYFLDCSLLAKRPWSL